MWLDDYVPAGRNEQDKDGEDRVTHLVWGVRQGYPKEAIETQESLNMFAVVGGEGTAGSRKGASYEAAQPHNV